MSNFLGWKNMLLQTLNDFSYLHNSFSRNRTSVKIDTLTLSNLKQVYHGVATPCRLIPGTHSLLFEGIHENFTAGRYHSWIVDTDTLPEELEVTAEDENGAIMALQHKSLPVMGVQFHPESVLTPDGKTILKNWLKA